MTDRLPDKAHFRPDEIASYFDVHVRTVYRWLEEKQMPCLRLPGGDLRVPRNAVLQFGRQYRSNGNTGGRRRIISRGVQGES